MMHGVTAYLSLGDSAAAISWYERVFGAREVRSRLVTPDGACANAEIEIEGTRIMLSDAVPDIGSISPEAADGTTVVLSLHVKDADVVFARALAEGAREIYPLADQFYGDRAGRVRDPFGHHWIIATQIKELSDEDMVREFQKLFTA